MRKTLFVLFLSFITTEISFAQTNTIPKNIQKLYEGRWIIERKYYTNTIEIKFEPNTDYATLIDIGSGEAPPLILKAYYKDNKLVIPAKVHESDYVEMTIKKGNLIFKTGPSIETEDGVFKKPDSKFLISKVFKKAKNN